MLILASASPRRQELLKLITNNFRIDIADIVEEKNPQLSPGDYVEGLALEKAEFVLAKNPQSVVIGADTVVILKNEFLGKPTDFDHARQMLTALSGQLHQVYTGVAVVSEERTESFYVVTDVEFDKLTAQEIDDYINSGEPMDKAGAYGIQGLGGKFVTQIRGDFFSVMGLPINPLYRLLKRYDQFSYL